MTLQEKLKAFKDNFESGGSPFNVSKDVVEIMHKATDEIRASGILDRVLKAGARAPEFSLPNEYSETVSSGELLARGNLVMSFYRGGW